MLARRTSLRVAEWRQGLGVEVGPHVGNVALSSLRIVIRPKMRLDTLMAMIAYAFRLSDLALCGPVDGHGPTEQGFVDLLGLALLQAAESIARGGLLAKYRRQSEDLAAPRGRIDMRHTATRPQHGRLRCRLTELTADHVLNRVLAEGLRLAAKHVHSPELRRDLVRSADCLFPARRLKRLDSRVLAEAKACIDRRSSHYEAAMRLIALFLQGSHLGSHTDTAALPLNGFLLDMNRLFEAFLGRYLLEQAPDDLEVITQHSRDDVFAYAHNPYGWRSPRVRPDLVFRQRGQVIAVGDAKYRNHCEQPPSTVELYQLITYGLAYPMAEPRKVYLFFPLQAGAETLPAQLLFMPGGEERVRIALVGVPVDAILSRRCSGWWPLGDARE